MASPPRKRSSTARRVRPGAGGVAARGLALAGLLWLAGFVVYLARPAEPLPLSVRTDGVVALTGGPRRLARGGAVLAAGAARRLLVSGVAPGIRPAQLAPSLALPAAKSACCVDIGFSATDTVGNGEETARWAARHGYRSLRLVTAAYHMPRARAELAARLGPRVTLLADPVPDPQTPWAYAREYSKLLVRRLVLLVDA